MHANGVAGVGPKKWRGRIAVYRRAECGWAVRTRGAFVVDEGMLAHRGRVRHEVGPDLRIVVGQDQREVAVGFTTRDVYVHLGADVRRVAAHRIGERRPWRRDHEAAVEADGAGVVPTEVADEVSAELLGVREVAVHPRGAGGDRLLGVVSDVDAAGSDVAKDLPEVERNAVDATVVDEGDLDALALGDVQDERLGPEGARQDRSFLRGRDERGLDPAVSAEPTV